jgi:nucleotide-binding universal stress UspA family protein
MIAIKRVLVATDFSDASNRALDYGRELARSYQGELHVLHVADDIRWRYSLDMSRDLLIGVQTDLEETARERLNALFSREDWARLHARPIVRTSLTPAETIVACAREIGADVIVLGTHGRGGVSHFFLGTVAERVVRLASCPVLTVHAVEREFIAPETLMADANA